MVVAIRGSCSVDVAVRESVWEYRCVKVAVSVSFGVWKLWFVGAAVFGNYSV